MTFDVMAQNVSGHHGEFFVDIVFFGGVASWASSKESLWPIYAA